MTKNKTGGEYNLTDKVFEAIRKTPIVRETFALFVLGGLIVWCGLNEVREKLQHTYWNARQRIRNR